jgi:hypothetical protein
LALQHKQPDDPADRLYLYQDSPSFVLSDGRDFPSRNVVAAWTCYSAPSNKCAESLLQDLIQEERDRLRLQRATSPPVSPEFP